MRAISIAHRLLVQLGVTRLDRIPNDTIRQTIKVAPITHKLKETRLRSYGHVRRREEDYLAKRVMSLEVEGKRPRGRPSLRWVDKIKADLKERGLTERDAPCQVEAHDPNSRPHSIVGQMLGRRR